MHPAFTASDPVHCARPVGAAQCRCGRTSTALLPQLRDEINETVLRRYGVRPGPGRVRTGESSRPVSMNIRVGSIFRCCRPRLVACSRHSCHATRSRRCSMWSANGFRGWRMSRLLMMPRKRTLAFVESRWCRRQCVDRCRCSITKNRILEVIGALRRPEHSRLATPARSPRRSSKPQLRSLAALGQSSRARDGNRNSYSPLELPAALLLAASAGAQYDAPTGRRGRAE